MPSDHLKFSPFIKDAIVFGGEDKDYAAALINIDAQIVGDWCEKHKIAYTTYADLSQKEEVYDLIERDVKKVNERLFPEETRVHSFINLYKEFDADESELTRTRKLRRKFVAERYQDLVSALYGTEKQFTTQVPVKYRDGKESVLTVAVKKRQILT